MKKYIILGVFILLSSPFYFMYGGSQLHLLFTTIALIPFGINLVALVATLLVNITGVYKKSKFIHIGLYSTICLCLLYQVSVFIS
jgi:ABC-type Co2+ transport system permease subunit